MKTRHGFVSNSSSASFTIPLAALTPEQLAKIKDYHHTVLAMTVPATDVPHDPHPEWKRRWWLDPATGQPTKHCTYLDTWWEVYTPEDLATRFHLPPEMAEALDPVLLATTSMDNFDFSDFLARIGVPRDKIQASRYDDDLEWEADEDD